MKGAYSPSRLQKAVGNMAGAHLGFSTNPEGGVKTLPATSAETVEIKKLYPTARCVDFCFPGSEVLYSARALVDYWHREGLDDFQPPPDLGSVSKNSSWPFTTPESDNIDLLTQLNLLSLVLPQAKSLMPIIQGLVEKMGQHNTVKLLRLLSSQGTLSPSLLFKLAGIPIPDNKVPDLTKITDNPIPDLKEVTNINDKFPNTPGLKSLEDLRESGGTSRLQRVTHDMFDADMLVPEAPEAPETVIPKEPLYGAVIPLKGDKKQGYLLLGFLNLSSI